MTPLTVADIAGRSRKFWLECQTVPGHVRVLLINICNKSRVSKAHTRESDWISMASWTSISGKGKASVALSARVHPMVMVQDPQGIHTFRLRVGSLLPIQPPKVNALILQGMVKLLEILGEEFLVGAFKRNWLHA